MTRTFRRNILFAIAALAVQRTLACGIEDASPTSVLVPVSSMAIKTPLLVFDELGRLHKYDLASSRWTAISEIELNKDYLEFSQSGDGRRISYGGALKNQQSVTQLWLYDVEGGKNRLYYSRPTVNGFDVGYGVLSPDGRSLALFLDAKGAVPNVSAPGIYLIDSVTLRRSYIGNPWANKATQRRIWGAVHWSKDATELLIELREESPTDGSRLISFFGNGEWFSYRRKDRRFRRIGARQMGEGSSTATFDGLTRILHSGSLRSPDGRWTANLSKDLELTVRSNNGRAKQVGAGGRSHCIGDSLLMRGWLDSRHLVYRRKSSLFRGMDYIFDVLTGNTAELNIVSPGDTPVWHYTW